MPGSNVHEIGLRWGNEHEGIVGKLSKKNGKSCTNTAIGSTAGGPQTRERNLKSLGAAPPSFAKVHNFAGTLAAAKLTGKLCKGHAAGGGCGILRSAGWRERKPMKLKLVVLALAIVCASQAAADSFNAFYSFGDSSVDSGWWSGALQGQCDGAPTPCTTGKLPRIHGLRTPLPMEELALRLALDSR